MKEVTSVDDYLEAVPEPARAALERIRRTIRAAAPKATEGISYQIPVFKHEGRPLVGFGSGSRRGGAAKSHCSFYVMSPSVIDAHKDELKRYETAKGTVHFPIGRPLPVALVKKLVKARIEENQAGVTG